MATTVLPTVDHSRSQSSIQAEAVVLPWVIASLWALCFVTFSLPNRVSPDSAEGIDILGVAKLLVRMGVIGTGALLISRFVGEHTLRPELRCYLSLFPFLLWSGMSVVWSPLRSISIGQYLGLIAILIFSSLVATVCSDARHYSRILSHLHSALFFYSVFVLIVYLIDPYASGLVRDALLENELGMVHPTAAGATASLGLVLITYQQLSSFRSFRPITFALFGVAHSLLLILANSRSAIGMTVIAVALMIILLGTSRLQAVLLLTASTLCVGYLALDPGFELVTAVFDQGSEFVSRGQSAEELSGGSGRVELWEEILRQFEEAILIGHGYFMTSGTGYLDVWDGREMRDAHNVGLQILVSTGIVGIVLFLLGSFPMIRAISQLNRGDFADRQRFGLAVVTGVWFLGWGMGCSTFMGAIRPESVVFMTVLGMSVGAAASQNCCHSELPSPSGGTCL